MNEEQYNSLSQSLNDLNQNTVATNNSINELYEYFLIKDKKAQEEKEKQAKLDAENQEKAETEQTQAEEEQATQEQTYTEQLQNINTQLETTNGMLVGTFVTQGILCGVLLFTILWNKLN